MPADLVRAPPNLRLVEIDEDHAKSVLHNMLIIVWKKHTTAEAFSRVPNIVQQIAALHREGVGMLQVVETGAFPPDSAARAEFLRNVEVSGLVIRHFSIVHEGTGFKAASVRAIMSGLYLYARPKFPNEIFNSLRGAAEWHAKEQRGIGRLDSPETLEGAVRYLRNELAKYP